MSLESEIEAALERALVHPCADDFSALHALLPDALAELRRLQAELDDRPPKGQHAALIVRLSDASAERDAALAQVEELEGALREVAEWNDKRHDLSSIRHGHVGVREFARRVLDSEEQTPEVSP